MVGINPDKVVASNRDIFRPRMPDSRVAGHENSRCRIGPRVKFARKVEEAFYGGIIPEVEHPVLLAQ